jgi:hypothetical protein
MGLLMSYGKTKTLDLGIQDWEENNKMGFIWRIAAKQLTLGKKFIDGFLNRLGHMPKWGLYLHTSKSSMSNKVT